MGYWRVLNLSNHMPYECRYKPRLVYFLPHFWRPFLSKSKDLAHVRYPGNSLSNFLKWFFFHINNGDHLKNVFSFWVLNAQMRLRVLEYWKLCLNHWISNKWQELHTKVYVLLDWAGTLLFRYVQLNRVPAQSYKTYTLVNVSSNIRDKNDIRQNTMFMYIRLYKYPFLGFYAYTLSIGNARFNSNTILPVWRKILHRIAKD